METKKINKIYLGLAVIFVVGIFLRSYHFHDWLLFTADQVRDATLVGDVIDGKSSIPLLGPSMRKSSESKDNLFYLGPVYYYFQITSAKIFGNYPDKMAYPDLVFSILSIPLFFFFLRKYFSKKSSLLITGLYSMSYFSVQYSRFAWNPNAIPFFVILFLLSLYELLIEGRKTSMLWILMLGLSIGIGVQLHAILLILFPVVSIIALVVCMKRDTLIWKKWIIVLIVALLLNTGQLVSEFRSNFNNTKTFFSTPVKSDSHRSFLANAFRTMDCHVEGNAFIISSIGEKECQFSYPKFFQDNRTNKPFLSLANRNNIAVLILSLIFSVVGYSLFIYFIKNNKDEKKRIFLVLLLTYISLSFVLMIPIIGNKLTEFRYLINVFFVPFVFLGLMCEFVESKFSKKVGLAMLALPIIFATTNILTLKNISQELISGSRSNDHIVALGEAEQISSYMLEVGDNKSDYYLIGSASYVSNLYKPLQYLLKKSGVNLIQAEANRKEISSGETIFYVMRSGDNEQGLLRGRTVQQYKNFGKIAVFKLNN